MERFAEIIEKLDSLMLRYCKSTSLILNTAVEDLIDGGGKRLRPIMVMLAGSFGNFDEDKLLHVAAGIELLHMATLVHDDIIDEARLRRGKITAQEKFGNDVAVFVGDYLLTKSYSLFVDNLSKHSLLKLNKVVKMVCIGEIRQYEEKYVLDLSLIDYFKRIRRKTALLFAISAYIGAYESGVRGKNLFHLYKFALEMGMAFQIQDDILDFVGEEDITGKEINQDLCAGIYTLPPILLLRDEKYGHKARELLDKKDISRQDMAQIIEMIKKSAVLELSSRYAEKFIERARNNLNYLPDIIEAKKDIEFILNLQLQRQI